MAGRVYLVRHGVAEKEGERDALRRLTTAGRDGVTALAARLGPRLAVTRILTSPLVRARETAALLAAATGAPVAEEEALASGASSGSGLLALARRAGPGAALVGHNPELGEAVAIAAGRSQAVPAGTIAALEVTEEGASLAWLEVP
ncbi:MAG TPA: histidine phosphatase family protein [Anaeromyxobacter sp.]|nr:histidine phosphatase family protein [Anaeromyxobacter sp.]